MLAQSSICSFQPPSPAASTVSMLNDDTTDLIERLADVQQEKWLLEEKVGSKIKLLEVTTVGALPV